MLSLPDFWSGVLFITIGGIGLWIGRNYPLGTLFQMGPGFFPTMISLVLVAIGLVIVLQAAHAGQSEEGMGVWPIRAMVMVLGGMLLFGILASRLGIVVAGSIVTILPGLATDEARPLELAIFSAVLVLLSVLTFVYLLGLNLPIVPWD